MWDDDVEGGGGLCQGLSTLLEQCWQDAVQEWALKRPRYADPIIDNQLLGPGYNLLVADNLARIDVSIITPPEGLDFWYRSDDFAKYGFLAELSTNGPRQTQVWWNFPQQSFFPERENGGVSIFLQGLASVGLATAYQASWPPDILFNGFDGLQGSYNETGIHT